MKTTFRAGRLTDFLKKNLGELICLFLPGLLLLIYNLSAGQFVNLYSDAELYYSIAENFASTGHFIQTSRDIANFVVPFGTPLILTVLHLIGLPLNAIVGLQYFLPGIACMFLYKTEKILLGWGGPAPVFFCVALLRLGLNVNCIYVEYYYLPLMAWALYLSIRKDLPLKKQLTGLNAVGFAAFAIRPVLAVVYAAILLYTLVCVCRKKFPAARFALLLLIPAVILGGNAAVNHRETGQWILMDSYSGQDVYLANNANTKPWYFYYEDVDEFVGEEFFTVTEDPKLDQPAKSAQLKAIAMDWIRSHPKDFLRNARERFRSEFIRCWRDVLIVCVLGAVYFAVRDSRYRWWAIGTLLLNLILAAVTSFGIIVIRYTVVVWPLASVHLAVLVHELFRILFRKKSRQKPT